MRVLNVNALIDPVSGAGTVERTLAMSQHLAAYGVKCSILTTDYGLSGKPVDAFKGLDIIALPCITKRFYIPWLSLRRIKNIVRKVDVVHLMGHWTVLNALVYLVIKNQKKPYVVCPAGALPIYGRSRLIKWMYNLIIGKKIIANADKHIAISPNEIEQYAEYRVAANKVLIIPNGINPEDFSFSSNTEFRKKINMGDNKFILYLGRLNHIKGPDIALEAFCNIRSEYPDYRLLFVGPDAGMLATLKQFIKARDINRSVHFIDYLGGEDKSRVYHAAEFLVIPSRQEAMSIVVLEAGMCGTPVLLTDTCGFKQVADVGGGCVVSASVKGIEDGIRAMLKDSEELKNMGARLEKYIEKQFTWSITAKQYLAMYEEMRTGS